MKTVDFSRSFLTFRIDQLKKRSQTATQKSLYTLNNARIQIECRCRIDDSETGVSQTFVLGASCKTERVGAERDIWTEPNADFAPIFSDTGFMNLKTYAQVGQQVDLYPRGSTKQSDRQTGIIAEAFDSVRIDVVECDGIELSSAREVVEATLAGRPLVATTLLHVGRYLAFLEYPVKTMNVNERDMVYQTDTGPVLLPDFFVVPDSLIAGFELAYAAFNCPDWVELVIRVATNIADDIDVYHYSRLERFDGQNRLVALG